MQTINYDDRIVFFFDILGFRDTIKKSLTPGFRNCQQIKDILSYINRFYEDEITSPYTKTKQISFFSDSIIISFQESEPDVLFHTLCDIQILLINLINRGIIMRGAISYGKLYHDKDFILGPAFIDAYDTETTKAIYQRIICDKSILLLNHGKISAKAFEQDLPYFFDVFSIDNDDVLYIDYFEKGASTTDSGEEELTYLHNLRKLIKENIKKTKKFKNKDIKKKYIWMKIKFNEGLSSIQSRNDIKKIHDPVQKKLYNKLKAIK